MNAAEPFQEDVIERLDAQRKPGNACLPEGAKRGRFYRPRIGLQRYLQAGQRPQAGADLGEQTVDDFWRKEAGGATTDKNSLHTTSPDAWQFAIQIGK